MAPRSDRDPQALPAVLRDGALIVGILLVWGVLAAIGVGISNVGDPGSILIPLGEAWMWLFIVAGLANVLLFVIARGIARSRPEASRA